MSFWSNEQIKQHGGQLFDPYISENVDYSGYKLSVGAEVFVTGTSKKKDRTSYRLSENETVRIPSGQFALIQTDERVTMPDHAMGLISMSAGKKLNGLINVSGFHVDPGYSGKLLFSAFNAGPNDIFLKRHERVFSIWIVDLVGQHTQSYPLAKVKDSIDSDRASPLNISDERKSLPFLAEQLQSIELRVKWGIAFISTAVVLLLPYLFESRDSYAEIDARLNQLQAEVRTQEVEITQPISVVPPEQLLLNIERVLSNYSDQQDEFRLRLEEFENTESSIQAVIERISQLEQELTLIRAQNLDNPEPELTDTPQNTSQ